MDDLEVFRYSHDAFGEGKPIAKPKSKTIGPFIRGPIPMDWLVRAARIPRRNAVLVGLVLFHLAGMKSERNGLVLCVERCKPFELGRKAVQRGLADLESHGLVRVDRSAGRCPRVDLVVD
ncbi:MAG: hypothetical protein WCI02_15910 [Planctomycetota bacterium]